jgi:hypothetical protein
MRAPVCGCLRYYAGDRGRGGDDRRNGHRDAALFEARVAHECDQAAPPSAARMASRFCSYRCDLFRALRDLSQVLTQVTIVATMSVCPVALKQRTIFAMMGAGFVPCIDAANHSCYAVSGQARPFLRCVWPSATLYGGDAAGRRCRGERRHKT